MQELLEIKTTIKDRDTVLFSLYYHDVIYNPLKTTNEEKSAEFAANRLQSILAPALIIKGCVHQILATKKHANSNDSDTNYFTDADLSILGQKWELYTEYYKNVRKEYSLYPDLIYTPGRKYPGKGGWVYTVIKEITPHQRAKFGWVQVSGTIDDFEIKRYKLMPMKNGSMYFPIRAEIRKAIGKKEGDSVNIILYAESEQQYYIKWIYTAKQAETRIKRMPEAISNY